MESNFNISQNDIQDVMASLDEMQHLSNGVLSEFEPFSGMMEDNKSYQVRTGIIQDPNYPSLRHRVDENDDEIVGLHTTTSSLKAKYPLNCRNAVDNYGMRVSIVWLDGNETGLYQNAEQSSTVGKPVQKLWLTFPNAWSDRDRSCGDFSLPINGTVCRIGMVRGDVGVFLGAVPLDKENLPVIDPGDFLRRHHNQNSQYITGKTTQAAHNDVLDKDIHKKAIKLQAVAPSDKAYETDEGTLGNLYHYHSNRHVLAKDGISTTTKVCNNKHSSVCNKRIWEWNTNLNLSEAFDETITTLNGLENLIQAKILCTEGDWSISQSDSNKFTTQLNTMLKLEDAITLVQSKLPDAEMISINAIDGTLKANKNLLNHTINVSTANATIFETLDLVKQKFLTTTNCSIDASDGSLKFNCLIGFLNAVFTINSFILDLNTILSQLKIRFTYRSGNITANDGVMLFTCDVAFNFNSMNITTSFHTMAEVQSIITTNFLTVNNTVSVNITASDSYMIWALRRGFIASSIIPAAALVAIATAIMGRPGKFFTASGLDMIIRGTCIANEQVVDVVTCTLPNT